MKLYRSYSPDIAADFIAAWEGFEEKAYICPAGLWTIGYGHTHGVKEGDRITREAARELLVKDISRAVKRLAPYVKVPVTEGQFIALTSLAFNTGPDYVIRHCPKLMRALNAGLFEACAEEFLDIVKANGKVLPGLVRRRRAEHVLFLGIGKEESVGEKTAEVGKKADKPGEEKESDEEKFEVAMRAQQK